MINVERAEALIVELQSGRWAKTRGVLHNAEGYCCQGVGCEMMMKAGFPIVREANPKQDITYDKYGQQGGSLSGTTWPAMAQHYFGFDDYQSEALQQSNDHHDTWDRVIDLIRMWIDEENRVCDDD